MRKYSANIKVVDSEASTCIQRNVGFSFIENHKYIMFLDDDNIFFPDAFYKMQNFLNNNKDFVGVAFNQIYKEKKNILDNFKKNYITNKIGIYSLDNGGFSGSGWQSRFVNFENNKIVQWLPTRAVIYRSSEIKK